MRWDVFCRVVDNLGDAGVCWRLAADLAARGERLRLWIDDPSPLAFMAPHGAPGVKVIHWTPDTPPAEPGDVVVEAFGCDPPPAFVEGMRALHRPPVWINLEYLSAEPYALRSHGLRSPQLSGPGRGLSKWFFYPGLVEGSGGLLREPGLMERRARFDASAWLAQRGIDSPPHERRVSLFAYADAPAGELARRLDDGRPTLLLLAGGAAQPALARAIDGCAHGSALRVHALPLLTQPDFDHLLWSCELNLVRGEDSLVRALWAGAPFVWQIYPQHDGVHARKLEAMLGAWGEALEPGLRAQVGAVWQAWNGFAPWPPALPATGGGSAWAAGCAAARARLLAQPDLGTRLLSFVRARR